MMEIKICEIDLGLNICHSHRQYLISSNFSYSSPYSSDILHQFIKPKTKIKMNIDKHTGVLYYNI